MRTTSESRRARIMAVALDEFMATGFDGTSMTQIAAHVGGSKATLYSYFGSKDELLEQSLLGYGKRAAQELSQLLNASGDFRTDLMYFITALLKRLYSPETIGILRRLRTLLVVSTRRAPAAFGITLPCSCVAKLQRADFETKILTL